MTAQESLLPCPFCGGEAVASEINPKDAPGWFHLTVTHNACFYKPSQEVLLLSAVELERWNRRAQPVARTPLSDEECDRVIAALCPDFSDQRFPGDRPIMRQLARDALAHGITQEKQG